MAEAPEHLPLELIDATESLNLTDLLYVVQDPAGGPVSKKATLEQVAELVATPGGGPAVFVQTEEPEGPFNTGDMWVKPTGEFE
jgi:hypothetical protein